MGAPRPNKDDLPVSRAVGRFFGHLWKAVKADPARPPAGDREEVSRTVEQEEAQGPNGERLTLRRTTIEEIEVRPPADRPPVD